MPRKVRRDFLERVSPEAVLVAVIILVLAIGIGAGKLFSG